MKEKPHKTLKTNLPTRIHMRMSTKKINYPLLCNIRTTSNSQQEDDNRFTIKHNFKEGPIKIETTYYRKIII